MMLPSEIKRVGIKGRSLAFRRSKWSRRREGPTMLTSFLTIWQHSHTTADSPSSAFPLRCISCLHWYLTLNTFLPKQPSPMSIANANQPSNCKPQNLAHLYYFGQRHITDNMSSLDLSIYNTYVSILFLFNNTRYLISFFIFTSHITVFDKTLLISPLIYLVLHPF